MRQIQVKITTLSQVVLTAAGDSTIMTQSKDCFAGNILRGVLAKEYIKQKHLGKEAHRNQAFIDLFFKKLRFVDANPAQLVDGVYQRAIKLPLCLQKKKIDNTLKDLLAERPESGYKTFKGLGIISRQQIISVNVQKSVTLHMSRSTDEERLSGKSREGGIFNYESIDAGQVFLGSIIGDEAELKELREALDLNEGVFECYIGRSKYTQYGHCRMELSGLLPLADSQQAIKQETVFLRLDTPFLPYGNCTDAKVCLEELSDQLAQMTGGEYTIEKEKIFAASTQIDSFVGIWSMKQPRCQAIAAGTVFGLKTKEWTETAKKALQQLLYSGIGKRTAEGFGQLRIWQQDKYQLGSLMEKNKSHTAVSEQVKQIAAQIIWKGILSQVRERAYLDAISLQGDVAKMTHAFARLENMLGTRENLQTVKQRFHTKFLQQIRQGSIIEGHLKKTRINKENLYDILAGTSELPYDSKSFCHDLPTELQHKINFVLPQQDNGEIFYEYCLWLFRHGRKQAVSSKKVRGEE